MSEIDPPSIVVLLPVALYAIASIVPVLVSGSGSRIARLIPSLLLMLGGGAGVLVALDALLTPRTTTIHAWTVASQIELPLRLDALAAFFLLVISLPAIAAAWYGLGYLEATHDRHGSQPRAATDALLGAFLASMSLLVLADGVVIFLLAWELMSLVSFFLVIGDGHRLDSRRAGYIYIVMTHIATGFLLLAFLTLMRHSGSFAFSTFRDAAGTLDGWERTVIFLLALLGFGTKAGLIPLHVWLPRAHPAAPSHVSALMSGVMVKTAIYGLARVIWEFAGPGPAWWGWLLIAAGAVSAVFGILYALMERDIKRVLAYSTVEQVGVITIGMGVAALATAKGYQAVAALAITAALLHLLNHSIFKGLLFLGAGAIQVGSGTRDLERLGGLVRRMPWTAGLFLTGALAIAALPPLNGFAGEWLLFQSLLGLGSTAGTASVATIVALAVGAVALTAGLSVACFVRAFGIGFLAQPRSSAARDAHEVDRSMLGGMALLAGCAVGLGLFPIAIVRLLRPVTTDLVGVTASPSLGNGDVLDATQLGGAYAPWFVVAGLVAIGIVPWLVARLTGGRGRERVAPTWVCGVELEPRMQYSATGFAKPIRLIFQTLIRPARVVVLERPISEYFVESVRYEESVLPVYEWHLYERGVGLLMAASHRVRTLQSGSIRAYLAYLLVTLIVVLLVAR